MDRVIEITNLTKTFGAERAVDGISLAVERGEFLGFLGPNGAGKTTTIAMMLGLVEPTSGTIRIMGQPMPSQRQRILSRVNFSSPYVSFPPRLSVRENLLVFSHLYLVEDARRKIGDLAELFGVTQLLGRETRVLSSGETARVNLAKAFLNDPEILFLDEPTAALDPEAADTVRTLLLRLQKQRGLTIFYTSHNMLEAERLSTRIVFLHKGQIIADGPPGDVLRQHEQPTLEEFFLTLAREGGGPEPPARVAAGAAKEEGSR